MVFQAPQQQKQQPKQQRATTTATTIMICFLNFCTTSLFVLASFSTTASSSSSSTSPPSLVAFCISKASCASFHTKTSRPFLSSSSFSSSSSSSTSLYWLNEEQKNGGIRKNRNKSVLYNNNGGGGGGGWLFDDLINSGSHTKPYQDTTTNNNNQDKKKKQQTDNVNKLSSPFAWTSDSSPEEEGGGGGGDRKKSSTVNNQKKNETSKNVVVEEKKKEAVRKMSAEEIKTLLKIYNVSTLFVPKKEEKEKVEVEQEEEDVDDVGSGTNAFSDAESQLKVEEEEEEEEEKQEETVTNENVVMKEEEEEAAAVVAQEEQMSATALDKNKPSQLQQQQQQQEQPQDNVTANDDKAVMKTKEGASEKTQEEQQMDDTINTTTTATTAAADDDAFDNDKDEEAQQQQEEATSLDNNNIDVMVEETDQVVLEAAKVNKEEEKIATASSSEKTQIIQEEEDQEEEEIGTKNDVVLEDDNNVEEEEEKEEEEEEDDDAAFILKSFEQIKQQLLQTPPPPSTTTTTTTTTTTPDFDSLEQQQQQQTTPPPPLYHDATTTSKQPTTDSINRAIVQSGISYFQTTSQKQRISSLYDANGMKEGIIIGERTKVPGCVATVYIRTILIPLNKKKKKEGEKGEERRRNVDAEDYKVLIDGEADAMLSRGLLALISQVLYAPTTTTFDSNKDGSSSSTKEEEEKEEEVMTAKHVLQIQPDQVAEMLSLRSVLSRGRNDGLQSMMNVIQNQIAKLLRLEDDDQEYYVKGLMMKGSQQGDQEAETWTTTTAAAATTTSGYGDGWGQTETSSSLDWEIPSSQTQKIISTTPTTPTTTTTTTAPPPPPPKHKRTGPTVAMLLSGGVDSSVALNLLLRQNYNVTAFYLKIWLEDELSHLGQCPWEDDYRACQQVCDQADVPLETISLQKQYKDTVIKYTVKEAEKGRTPNPDVMCNSRVKFGCFYEEIDGRGFDFVASGHYAQLVDEYEEEEEEDTNDNNNNKRGKKPKQKKLLRAPDPIKDQSYFLSALTQKQLRRVLFPIGKYQKSQVRQLASDYNLPNKDRPDSQGLCFLGKVKFDEFLSAYLGDRPGDIVDAASGRVIGKHRGLWYHTVGQRKGIGKVLDPKATAKGPWYVVAKDPSRDLILASNQYEEEVFAKARTNFFVEDISWVAGDPPEYLRRWKDGDYGDVILSNEKREEIEKGLHQDEWKEGRFDMKIRHGPTIVQGTLRLTDGVGGYTGNIRLDTKDGGLAPGQFVAFYTPDGDECLGSGVISEEHWANFLLKSETALRSPA